MSDSLLQVNELKTWFGTGEHPNRAVDGVSFSIRRGETFALLGESGCGKSITALSIMQLVPAPAGRIVSGSIVYDDDDLLTWPESVLRTVRGKRIAMIFQEPMTSLNPVLTIHQQIAETLRQHTALKGEQISGRVVELLTDVGIPDPQKRANDYPHQLSGGMRQRVMIAIALACEPELLIADEPTTALDVTIQAQVLNILKSLQKKKGMAVLLITHDLGVVADYADHLAIMYAGQIVEQGSREQLYANPQHPYTKKLFAALPSQEKRDKKLEIIKGSVPPLTRDFSGCRFVDRCDYAWDECKTNVPKWLPDNDYGIRCHLFDPDKTPPINKPVQSTLEAIKSNVGNTSVLSVNDLKVHFPIRKGVLQRIKGYVYAVDGVSLDINSGETLALVGESGCGKTTVGKAILRLIQSTAGEIVFNNHHIETLDEKAMRAIRNQMQIIFQDPYSSMNPRMQVGDIIEEGMISTNVLPDKLQRQQRIAELINKVGLPDNAQTRYPHEFSGGQRQRISIARVLAVDPKLIICDEPTSALDVSVQAQTLNLLKQLQNEFGLSYLFITHNISVVEYLAHRIAVMYLGRIVETGTVEEILQNAQQPYTQLLLASVPRIISKGIASKGIDGRASVKEKAATGELPSAINPPQGCHFHPRCESATETCRTSYPGVSQISETHTVKCYLAINN